MPLTDTALRNAKPSDKPYKIADSAGLYVLVNPGGSKLWRFKYRFNNREKLLALGSYPLLSLKLAREKRDEARLLLLEGRDPSAERQARKQSLAPEVSNTFETIASEYLIKLERSGRSPATMKKTHWLLDAVDSKFGRKAIDSITAMDVLQAVQKFEDQGKYETATRLRSTIGTVIRFAIATGRATNDPTVALKGALIRPTVKPRAAILEPKGLGQLLRDIDAINSEPGTKAALQLLALLAPRPGELRLAHWEEFDFDEAVWRVPADRTKMRRAHRVPLPRQAVAILSEYKRLKGNNSHLFPSVQDWKKPISDNTLNAALKRIGYGTGVATAHGFRASFSTIANESGRWHPDAIERALGHVEGNDVRRAYARGEHWEERVRLAQWWADQLDDFRKLSKKR